VPFRHVGDGIRHFLEGITRQEKSPKLREHPVPIGPSILASSRPGIVPQGSNQVAGRRKSHNVQVPFNVEISNG